jgi:hypothetical protein
MQPAGNLQRFHLMRGREIQIRNFITILLNLRAATTICLNIG